VRFGEAYEVGGVEDEELATTLGGGADVLRECFNPKPSPKPSPRPRRTTTTMPPISRHGSCLLPFFAQDEGTKSIFCSDMAPSSPLGRSAKRQQNLSKKSEAAGIAPLSADEDEMLWLS
jgi:hypothetical protein